MFSAIIISSHTINKILYPQPFVFHGGTTNILSLYRVMVCVHLRETIQLTYTGVYIPIRSAFLLLTIMGYQISTPILLEEMRIFSDDDFPFHRNHIIFDPAFLSSLNCSLIDVYGTYKNTRSFAWCLNIILLRSGDFCITVYKTFNVPNSCSVSGL